MTTASVATFLTVSVAAFLAASVAAASATVLTGETIADVVFEAVDVDVATFAVAAFEVVAFEAAFWTSFLATVLATGGGAGAAPPLAAVAGFNVEHLCWNCALVRSSSAIRVSDVR